MLGTVTHRAVAATSTSGFPFRDGDRVVFLGDSITAQKMYTSYIETYLLTRFPNWHLQFRNAGWGGDTSNLIARGVPAREGLERDVLSLKPTVVTINFGMNDGGYGEFKPDLFAKHLAGETAIVKQLQAAGVRPIVLTSSALEKAEPGDNMVGYNQTLEQFAAGDAGVAAAAGVPFADQLHPFVEAINRLRSVGPALRLSATPVHPDKAGHLMMADFILSALNAPSLVSQATIDAVNGAISHNEGATITKVVRTADGISFRRLDQALLFPIDPAARPVLQVVPVADDINRYMVQVTNLQPGSYIVSVDGVFVARCSAQQLNMGVNLGYYDSPLAAAGSEILKHVLAKNLFYDTFWHSVQLADPAPADKTEQTASFTRKIAAEEAAIDALRHPQPFQFEIKRAVTTGSPTNPAAIH